MTEKLIQKALLQNFASHEYKFANAFYFGNESDFLSFLPSGFCYEVEIKISRSDFKADFKKQKHSVHRSNESNSKYFLQKRGVQLKSQPDWEFCRCFPELVESSEYEERVFRTDEYQMKVHLYAQTSSKIDFIEQKNTQLPNKFFYAVPTGLIKKEEVPDYAGLLYIDDNLKVTKVKDGKFLHKDKLSPAKLFNKTYYSYLRELHQKLTVRETLTNNPNN